MVNKVIANSEEFIRNRTKPVPMAITMSMTTLIAMLVSTDLMVLASE